MVHIQDAAYKSSTARFSSRPGGYKGFIDRKSIVINHHILDLIGSLSANWNRQTLSKLGSIFIFAVLSSALALIRSEKNTCSRESSWNEDAKKGEQFCCSSNISIDHLNFVYFATRWQAYRQAKQQHQACLCLSESKPFNGYSLN